MRFYVEFPAVEVWSPVLGPQAFGAQIAPPMHQPTVRGSLAHKQPRVTVRREHRCFSPQLASSLKETRSSHFLPSPPPLPILLFLPVLGKGCQHPPPHPALPLLWLPTSPSPWLPAHTIIITTIYKPLLLPILVTVIAASPPGGRNVAHGCSLEAEPASPPPPVFTPISGPVPF